MEALNTWMYVIAHVCGNRQSLMVISVKLDDSVEYKSLPSGLHNVSEDLMYAFGVYQEPGNI